MRSDVGEKLKGTLLYDYKTIERITHKGLYAQ